MIHDELIIFELAFWIISTTFNSRKNSIWESRFKSARAIFSRGCAVVGTFRKLGC